MFAFLFGVEKHLQKECKKTIEWLAILHDEFALWRNTRLINSDSENKKDFIKNSINLQNVSNSLIDNTIWYHTVIDSLIPQIEYFLNKISDYNCSSIPKIIKGRTSTHANGSPIFEENYDIIYDPDNDIPFNSIDILCKNYTIRDALKNIYEKYKKYKKYDKQQKHELLLNYFSSRDVLNTVTDYLYKDWNYFDHVITMHKHRLHHLYPSVW